MATQLDSDNFNTYSDGALATVSSGKWSNTSLGSVAVVSNQIHNGANENAAVITSWSGSTTTQYSEVLYVSGNYGGPTIFNDGVSTFYLCELASASNVILYKVVSGGFTSLASAGSVTNGHTYRIRCETVGTIIISDNGSDLITFSDSSITSGKPGIRSWSNFMDDWTAGDFGIAADASSNSAYQAASSSYSWSHVCSGGNRYLVVGVGMLSLAQTVTGITYNSVAMTFLGSKNSVTGACRVELWGLIAPTTGSNTIAVSLSGSIASAGVAVSYTGVHQTSPTEGFNSAQATNVGAADATVNVTTVADNDMVVDIVATDDTAITVGAGQTSRNNVTGAGGSAANSDELKGTAGSVTMSWTNVAALATWSIGAIALRPSQAASLGTRTDGFFFGA